MPKPIDANGDPEAFFCRHCDGGKVHIRGVLFCPVCDRGLTKPTWQETV